MVFNVTQWRTAVLVPHANFDAIKKNTTVFLEERDFASKLGAAVRLLLLSTEREFVEETETVPITAEDHRLHEWYATYGNILYYRDADGNEIYYDIDDTWYDEDGEAHNPVDGCVPVYEDMSRKAKKNRGKIDASKARGTYPQYRKIKKTVTVWNICPHIEVDDIEKHIAFLKTRDKGRVSD